jgi:hypothetical protein
MLKNTPIGLYFIIIFKPNRAFLLLNSSLELCGKNLSFSKMNKLAQSGYFFLLPDRDIAELNKN